MTSAPPSGRASRLLAPPRPGRLGAWSYALRTTNPPPDRDPRTLDGVTKWLVVTRAAVLPMTVLAGLVAGLLAVRADGFSWPLYLLALLGITLAHACNNIMNDLSDTDVGLDTDAYPRALYAPHPILSGMVRRKQMGLAVIGLNLACFVVMVVLATQRGWPVVAFAVLGIVLSIAYTSPPLRLKARGLGEPDVFVVWGPLMVAGTYFSAVGELPWQVWLASVPYGLLCTTVLMGKHTDKIPYDAPLGIKTVPVLLGAPRSLAVTKALIAGFYVLLVVAVVVRAMPWPALLGLAGLPGARTTWQALSRPAPTEKPKGFPVWPLWYAAWAFLHTRNAGAALIAGVALAAVVNVAPFGTL